MTSQIKKQTILIVDDAPENIHILTGILKGDYRIKAATNGGRALKIVSASPPPDLILLDIIMPGMDGYQVCRHLKQNKETRAVPVIFITGRSDPKDEVKGFELGAVDYITKPVEPALVRTQIELKMHRDHMEALAEARAHQLLHAERLSTLGLLSAGIAHEINNPLTFISGNAGLLQDDLKNLHHTLDRVLMPTHPDREAIDRILCECKESVGEMIKGSRRMAILVRNMKELSRQDDHTMATVDLNHCIQNAVALCRFSLKYTDLHLDMDSNLPGVWGNMQQIEQVLINLFNNAVDAVETVETPEITLTARTQEKNIRICVADNGPGIPEEKIPIIWDAFYTTKTRETGTGLGLSISKGIIENHEGRIWVENRQPQGACFTIELPVAKT